MLLSKIYLLVLNKEHIKSILGSQNKCLRLLMSKLEFSYNATSLRYNKVKTQHSIVCRANIIKESYIYRYKKFIRRREPIITI